MNEDGAVVLYSDVRVLLTVGKAIQVTGKRSVFCATVLSPSSAYGNIIDMFLGKRSIEKRIPSDLN
jgi:hypothetical protein